MSSCQFLSFTIWKRCCWYLSVHAHISWQINSNFILLDFKICRKSDKTYFIYFKVSGLAVPKICTLSVLSLYVAKQTLNTAICNSYFGLYKKEFGNFFYLINKNWRITYLLEQNHQDIFHIYGLKSLFPFFGGGCDMVKVQSLEFVGQAD